MAAPSRADLEYLVRHPHVIQAELAKWRRVRRSSQVPPDSGRIWLLHTGRGWGKTRTAAEFLADGVGEGVEHMLAIGPTATDVHDVMVPMLIRVLGARGYAVEYLRSIEAPAIKAAGTIIHLRTGTRIDRCRGLGVGLIWCDEIDSWKPEQMSARDAWLGVVEPTCRMAPARMVVTSTPKRGGLVAWLSTRADVCVTRGHSRENEANLAPGFVAGLSAAYAGSWLERQELGGEIVAEVDGALVTHAMLEATRVAVAPELRRISVGVDPSGGTEQQGIVGAGLSHDAHLYVLADRSCCVSPAAWGLRAVALYGSLAADRIVLEVNFGGDMAESTIRTVDKNVPIRRVTASRGKHIRFEPLAALFAQGRAHIVGSLPELEDEITAFTADGYEGSGSPNRADALVWACEDLIGSRGASPADLYGPDGAFAA